MKQRNKQTYAAMRNYDFKIREQLKQMPGGAGSRSVDDLNVIKLKLAAAMLRTGEQLYPDIKAGFDPYAEDPELLEALCDIDALLNEILIYKFKQ